MLHRVNRKQPNSKMCWVCGLKNPLGLKASFYETEAGEVVGVFTPPEEYQGYPGRLHGGVASAILDETIGRAIMIKYSDEIWWVTVELNIRFRKPVPLDQELRATGRVTDEGSRFFEGTGEVILPDGKAAVTARGKYIRLPIDRIADFDTEENEWRVVPSDNDPEEIGL